MRGSIFAEESGEGSANDDARRGTNSVFRRPDDAESTDGAASSGAPESAGDATATGDVDPGDEPTSEDANEDEPARDYESGSAEEPDDDGDGERDDGSVGTMTVFSGGEVYELGVDE